MKYLEIELLRLHADRALGQDQPIPWTQRKVANGRGSVWLLLVGVLATIPSTAPWLG